SLEPIPVCRFGGSVGRNGGESEGERGQGWTFSRLSASFSLYACRILWLAGVHSLYGIGLAVDTFRQKIACAAFARMERYEDGYGAGGKRQRKDGSEDTSDRHIYRKPCPD